MMAGCGALHDAPISDAKANKNAQAVERVSTYSGTGQRAVVKAPQGKKATTRIKATREGEADMQPVAQTSDIPAWVTAINWAQTKLGHRYIWGGNGYDNKYDGFDCSGLTKAAYAQAGITLPRVAQDQYHATNVHPTESELRPGDLVFFGTRWNIHHVGIYVGKNDKGQSMMLHAPNSRTVIKFSPVHYMNDYFGATRVSP
jgi:cell wall-associated NlpC family hydrolase